MPEVSESHAQCVGLGINARDLATMRSFKSVHLVFPRDVYRLTVNALTRTHV